MTPEEAQHWRERAELADQEIVRLKARLMGAEKAAELARLQVEALSSQFRDVVAESHEQARLLGAGGERELRLMAERDKALEQVARLTVYAQERERELGEAREAAAVANQQAWTLLSERGPRELYLEETLRERDEARTQVAALTQRLAEQALGAQGAATGRPPDSCT